MRPIKLTMSAFGPYSNVEVIDFEELQERNLFLVTGPTGSGKTTIFDAISYALYGKASGDLRTEETLRSHFSEPELLTEVDLTFELKGTLYHVHRMPKQIRPKTRSEGFTEQKPEATLTIDDENPKTIIAGVSKVNKKIEEILGINEEQFKQIMMIPQGEFRKLLTSDSQEREKVLQQLFDTYIYRRIQNELNERAKALGGDIKSKKVARDTLITKIKCGDDDELQEMIEAEDKFIDAIVAKAEGMTERDADSIKSLGVAIKKLDRQIEATVKEQTKSLEDNKNLEQKALVSEDLKVQEALAVSMADQQKVITRAEKAARLVGTEENILLREKTLVDKEESQRTTELKVGILAKDLEVAKKALEVVTTSEAEAARSDLKIRLAELKSYVGKVTQLDVLTKDIERAETRAKTLNQNIEAKTLEQERSIDVSKAYQIEMDGLKKVEVLLEKTNNSYEKEEVKRSRLGKVMTQLKSLALMEERSIRNAASVEAALEVFEKDQRDYKEGKYLFASHQAAFLAKELAIDTPCPVCGSKEHPNPAVLPELSVTEAELEALEQKMKTSEAKLRKAEEGLAVQQERCNNQVSVNQELIEEVYGQDAVAMGEMSLEKQMDEVHRTIQVLEKTLKAIKVERVELGVKKKRYSFLGDAITKGLAFVEQVTKEIKELETEKTRLGLLMTENKTKLNHVYEEVPEALRQVGVLQQSIKAREDGIIQSDEKLKTLGATFEQVTKAHIQTVSTFEALTKSIADEKGTLESLKSNFSKQISEAGFHSKDAYGAAKVQETQIEEMKEAQINYHRNLDRLRESLKTLEHKTKGLAVVEMQQYEEQLKVQQDERELMTDQQGVVKARITDNEATIMAVVGINHQIKDKESKYNVVGQLAKVAQGNNPKMMTFERYVLAAFLEDILKAANGRLRQMTQGRYILSRTEELQRKNKQSGLELEVFDNFTGKSRHVKTLSGGEGFKASLSMALGLSDVVQSYAGGVRLDTMFIDEGFGTLDQESLDSAIDCLIDLQKSGRLVGIISHVQELKERIDTRLEIISTNKGSETRFVLG